MRKSSLDTVSILPPRLRPQCPQRLGTFLVRSLATAPKDGRSDRNAGQSRCTCGRKRDAGEGGPTAGLEAENRWKQGLGIAMAHAEESTQEQLDHKQLVARAFHVRSAAMPRDCDTPPSCDTSSRRHPPRPKPCLNAPYSPTQVR